MFFAEQVNAQKRINRNYQGLNMPKPELENEKLGKVLLIDDDSLVLDCLVEALDEHCHIRAAIDAGQAFKLIDSGYIPDLILLDIMLPDVDGYEACATLKQLEATRNVPVIFLSALGKYEDEIKGLEVGAVDYILKPFSPAIVLTRVKTHLELNSIVRLGFCTTSFSMFSL
jgi:putative two-component system response regulator